MKNKFHPFLLPPHQTAVENVLSIDPNIKGTISKIKILLFTLYNTNTDHLRLACSMDLRVEVTEEQWKTALSQTHKTSICARLGLLQFKILH